MYVCLCHGVTDKQIRKAVSEGASSVTDLGRELGVATACGGCRCMVEQLIEESAATGTMEPPGIDGPGFWVPA